MATAYGGYLNQYYTKPSYTSGQYNQKVVSAPTTARAPTTVNYSGPAGYSGYVGQNANSTYGNYLNREYADPTKLATNQKGETAYDLQRQQVTGDVEAERGRQQEDLRRRLAASGMDNSGMAFKQNRQLAKDLGEYGGQQKSGIAIEEMGARERQATRLGEQAFTSTESGLERAESQRQFDSDQNLRVALQGNANAMRAWTEGNKQAFDTWVEQNGISKDDADRAWKDHENERNIESALSRDLAGRDYGDVIAQRAESRKAETEYYFTSGQTGSMTEGELAALKESNPSAWIAYKSGQEGKTLEETDADAALTVKLQDAYITAMTDPNKNAAYIKSIASFAEQNDIDLKIPPPKTRAEMTPEEIAAQEAANDSSNYQTYYKGAASESSPNNYAYTEKLKTAPVVNTKIDNPRMNLLKDMPEAGSLVNVGGRLMQVVKTNLRNQRSGWDVISGTSGYLVTNSDGTQKTTTEGITGREADSFELLDLSTGKTEIFAGTSGDISGAKSINNLNDWASTLELGEV